MLRVGFCSFRLKHKKNLEEIEDCFFLVGTQTNIYGKGNMSLGSYNKA